MREQATFLKGAVPLMLAAAAFTFATADFASAGPNPNQKAIDNANSNAAFLRNAAAEPAAPEVTATECTVDWSGYTGRSAADLQAEIDTILAGFAEIQAMFAAMGIYITFESTLDYDYYLQLQDELAAADAYAASQCP